MGIKTFFHKKILPCLAFALIYILCSTLRVKVIGREHERGLERKKRPVIYVFWHGRMLFFPFFYRFANRYTLLVSPSRDGELVSHIARLFGFFSVRGSGYEGGARALRQLIRILKQGHSIGIIGDGSRGPVCQAQKGIIRLAGISGAALLPITYGASRKIVFRSWDRFYLPLPFARVKVVYGRPLNIPRGINPEEEEALRLELEARLIALTRQADGHDATDT